MRPILAVLLFALPLLAQPSGDEILSQLIKLMNPGNAQGVARMTITTTTGQTRTFEYDTYVGDNGASTLTRYRSPSRVKGNAMLMTDNADNIWMYYRQTRRVRKLASHARRQNFEGSDFTYEDMGSGDSWKTDYTPQNSGSGKVAGEDVYRLILTANSKDMSYSRLECWVRQSDSYPLEMDYYDQDGIHLKTLKLEDIQIIEGIPTAMKMTMDNHLDRTQTIMETIEMTFDVSFKADFFTERNLKR